MLPSLACVLCTMRSRQVLDIIPVESPQQPWSPAPTSPRAADQSQLHVQQLRERMAQQPTSQVDIPSAAQPVAASQYQPTQPSQPQVVHEAARVPKLWTAPVQQASGGRGVGPGAAHTTQTFSAQAPVGSQTTLPTVIHLIHLLCKRRASVSHNPHA